MAQYSYDDFADFDEALHSSEAQALFVRQKGAKRTTSWHDTAMGNGAVV